MDVERLMKDLTVEQLENIHQNLQTEMEGKREELRDMVGRRYRDVLEASTEVRQVRSFADSLAVAIGQARATQSILNARAVPRGHHSIVQKFTALHHLLPLVGDEAGDGLSDAFSVILAENIHRQLISENISPLMQKTVNGLTQRIIRTKHALVMTLREELGELSEPDWVTNQLIALTLLQDEDMSGLLDLYLNSRKNYIESLVQTSISVLSLVDELKKTLIVVYQLFVQGDLNRALQGVASAHYRPKTIEALIGDQAFSFGKMMNTEIEKVNRVLREKKMGQLLTSKINEKCAGWLEEVCSSTHEYVASICSFYETTADIIEFLSALSEVMKEDWPRILTNTQLYRLLFKTVVVEKFKFIIGRDLQIVEQKLQDSLRNISSTPISLFEKRTGKFDALLGVGISSGLQTVVTNFFENIQKIREDCSKFEKISLDANVESIREALAKDFAEIVIRLTSTSTVDPQSCLTRARLSLALLHIDANTICLTLNKEGERISSVNKLLHSSVEDALSTYGCLLASECLAEAALHDSTDFSNPLQALNIAMEWEQVQHVEVGTVNVPICISPAIHSALFHLCRRLSDSSVAHLLSRSVRKRIANEVGERISLYLEGLSANSNVSQRTWIQWLFDCRVIGILFPHDRLKKLQASIQGHIDPFDLTLLSDLLSTNVRLSANRSQLLYACLVLDILPNKDIQPTQSFSQVIDIVPRNEHPQRLTLIPRLDRNPSEEASKRLQSVKTPKNKYLANPQSASKNASLSSFYDKMSSSFSFFGN